MIGLANLYDEGDKGDEGDMRTRSDLVRFGAPVTRPLTRVSVIMCYLAALALVGALGVSRWLDVWQKQAYLKMSLYIPNLENISDQKKHLKRIDRIIAILNSHQAISKARLVPEEEMLDLLSHFLGQDINLKDLPLPHLVDISLKPDSPFDRERLEKRIKAIISDVELDDHQQWHRAIWRWAILAQIVAGGILLLTFICMAAVIGLATRATINANRRLIAIFRLIGAEDRFIISTFGRSFLKLGFLTGLIGALGAGLSFFLIARAWDWVSADFNLSSIHISLNLIDYMALWVIPILSTVIAIFSSRHQLVQYLKTLP